MYQSYVLHGNRATGFPGGSEGKSICLQRGRFRFDPWIGKIPWKRAWQPTPVFLPVINTDSSSMPTLSGAPVVNQGPKSVPEVFQLHGEGKELGQRGLIDQYGCQDLAATGTRDWR